MASAGVLLTGCAHTRRSTALDPERARPGIRLQRSLPAVLPGGAQVLPQEQLVLLPGESAAGMLVPVPFLAGAIAGAMDRSEAASEAAQLVSIDPYALAQQAWQGSALLSEAADALLLQPFAFLQACVDDRYRIALVHQLSRGDWTGRYTVHLRSSYDSASFHRVTPELLQTLLTEMREGSAVLRGLVERAARGDLRGNTTRVDVGSLHLVGNRAAGLVAPTLLLARGAELIEEDAEKVLVRIDGDPSQPASAGGLFFGVHRLRKDQLHTFRPAQSTS
ncbi:hypothetical protein RA210_U250027 [Rubrivivax sp. A210]|nr:hypothetical protein RA210_U250027 [Rubrivivax sp. A210]